MQSELPLPCFDDPPQLDLRYDLVLMDCEEIQQLRSVAPEEVALPVIVRADAPAAAADLRSRLSAPDQRRGQPQQTSIVSRIPSDRKPEVLHIRFVPDLPVANASAIVFGQSGDEVFPCAQRFLPEIERDAPHRGRISDSLHVERIAEAAAATSKKTELKLTNVAKASQEGLFFDYQAFLRQRHLPEWSADSPESLAVRQARPADLGQLRNLMAGPVSDKSDKSDRKAEVAANVMICLINQETFLLGRQLARLEQEFVEEGGFTERLYRVRSARRSEKSDSITLDNRGGFKGSARAASAANR